MVIFRLNSIRIVPLQKSFGLQKSSEIVLAMTTVGRCARRSSPVAGHSEVTAPFPGRQPGRQVAPIQGRMALRIRRSPPRPPTPKRGCVQARSQDDPVDHPGSQERQDDRGAKHQVDVLPHQKTAFSLAFSSPSSAEWIGWSPSTTTNMTWSGFSTHSLVLV